MHIIMNIKTPNDCNSYKKVANRLNYWAVMQILLFYSPFYEEDFLLKVAKKMLITQTLTYFKKKYIKRTALPRMGGINSLS